ncbi:MAG: hypothetical protein IK078_08775 [Lachnospiraceae bacterium]|nr:hypothetical protein [Lachnospiraceae bacterium]
MTGEKIVNSLFDRVSDKGVLIIPSWEDPTDDDEAKGRFMKCFLEYQEDDVKKTGEELEQIIEDLRCLGKWYAKSKKSFDKKPDKKELERETTFATWERFIKKFHNDASDLKKLREDCIRRAGEGLTPYMVVIRVRRILKLYEINAPELVIDFEKKYLAEALIINRFATVVEQIDFLEKPAKKGYKKGDFEPEYGMPNPLSYDDFNAIVKLLDEDHRVNPFPMSGYYLLAGKTGRDLFLIWFRLPEEYDDFKETMDKQLDQLVPAEAAYIRERYGLSDGDRRTVFEIAEESERQPEQLEQMEKEILDKLKNMDWDWE